MKKIKLTTSLSFDRNFVSLSTMEELKRHDRALYDLFNAGNVEKVVITNRAGKIMTYQEVDE